MWTAIKTLVGPYLRQILMVGAIAGALSAWWFWSYHAGEKSEKVNALVQQTKTVRKVHAIQDKNRATLHDGDAAARLRKFWSRD